MLLDIAADALGDQRGLLEGAFQEQHELLTPVAGDEVVGPGAPLERASNAVKGTVAGLVAERSL